MEYCYPPDFVMLYATNKLLYIRGVNFVGGNDTSCRQFGLYFFLKQRAVMYNNDHWSEEQSDFSKPRTQAKTFMQNGFLALAFFFKYFRLLGTIRA